MDRAGTAAAVYAAAAAVWYGAVLLLSAWVYEPVGVSPRDLGLSSLAIVVQATVSLVAVLVIGVVAGAAVGAIWGAWHANRDPNLRQLSEMPLPFEADDPASNEAAVAHLREQDPDLSQEKAEQLVRAFHDEETDAEIAAIRASTPAHMASDEEIADMVKGRRRHIRRMEIRFEGIKKFAVIGASIASFLAVLLGFVAVIAVASDSRNAIHAGRASDFVLGLPAPWSTSVADVHPTGNAPAQGPREALPQCALFLGQHDSTVFLRDGSARTIRVPASTVRLDLRDRDRCP